MPWGACSVDFNQLRYFVAIAENGSIASAANAVGVSQPSVSVQLRNLEERLQTQLVIRSSRGVVLTETGLVLLDHARAILAAVQKAQSDVRQAGESPAGMVVFGFPSSVSMVLSVPLAETIRLEYPDIRLRAVDAMSGFIKRWVEDKSIDMAMLYDTTGLKNVEITTLLEEDLHFYAPPDLWPFQTPPGTPVPLAQLRQVGLVLPSQTHGLRMLIDRACRAAAERLNVVVEMDSLSQIKSLVARGSAFTILAPAAVSDFEGRRELVSAKIIEPTITRPVHLVRNPDRPRTRAAQEVERITLDVVRELVRRGIWRGRAIGADSWG